MRKLSFNDRVPVVMPPPEQHSSKGCSSPAMMARTLGLQLESAFNSVESSCMSTDFACKLLAFVYVLGGGNEQVVINQRLIFGISVAQQKFNLFGGRTPNVLISKIIAKYSSELQIAEKENNLKGVGWLSEICTRYDLQMNGITLTKKEKK